MVSSPRMTFSMACGAAFLCAAALPVSAAPTTIAPTKIVALDSSITPIASRKPARHARKVVVRRHYTGNRYYYRRQADGFSVAALGLFAGALGAAIASSSYDDGYYGNPYPVTYGYPYGGYGGYAQPGYNYGYYPTGRIVHRGYVGRQRILNQHNFVRRSHRR